MDNNRKEKEKRERTKKWMMILTVILVLDLTFGLYKIFQKEPLSDLTYSAFLNNLAQNQIAYVKIEGNRIEGQFVSGKSFKAINPNDARLVDRLVEFNVPMTAMPPDRNAMLIGVLLSWTPTLLLIGVWIYFMRKQMGGKGGIFNFGKSRAQRVDANQNNVTFADVMGIDEAKMELMEIVEFLKNPDRFRKIGGKIPKGVLLSGPPGTGKTLLAKAVAGEAGVPFYSASGSDFVEMFVGVGAARMRSMFEDAKKNAPCIVFIDEIDAIGKKRSTNLGGNEEREQALNQMLVEMDGFMPNSGVMVMASTNRPDVLDSALLRPGRFDRQIVVPLPDLVGREKILEVHVKNVKLDDSVSITKVARATPGFSGADLANLVNEAALFASRHNKDAIGMDDIMQARDRIIMGAERKSSIMPDDERLVTAYHESGHAVVASFLENTDPVHKVTIIPRGLAMGVTMQMPKEDRHGMNEDEAMDRICVLLAGRMAEKHFFSKVSTGAQNDIARATDIATKMVTSWGMGNAPIAFDLEESKWSEKTRQMVDEAIIQIVKTCEQRTTMLIEQYALIIEHMAKMLMVQETLEEKEIDAIIGKNTNKTIDV